MLATCGLHLILLVVAWVGISQLRPKHPTENQQSVLLFLYLIAYSIVCTIGALFSNYTLVWLLAGWSPVVVMITWAMVEMWDS